jgi:hypothetical protein
MTTIIEVYHKWKRKWEQYKYYREQKKKANRIRVKKQTIINEYLKRALQ